MADVKTWERLRAAAMACEGWSWPDRMRDKHGTHYFGQRREGEFYEVGTIDASTYTGEYADDIRVLKFIRAVAPKTILALLAENDSLRAALQAQQGDALDAARYRWLRANHSEYVPASPAASLWGSKRQDYVMKSMGALDAAIDAAMLAARREG
jgi:hypothetical protein